jgi:hypothetical protein
MYVTNNKDDTVVPITLWWYHPAMAPHNYDINRYSLQLSFFPFLSRELYLIHDHSKFQ